MTKGHSSDVNAWTACHDRVMPWPPKIGEPLPRSEDAYNVHDKLARYSLNPGHGTGGRKAHDFQRLLAITLADLEYLADSVLAGLVEHPVVEVRDRGEFGMHCRVIVPIRGLRDCADRVANVRTVWEIREVDAAPRLINAYITSKVR